MTEHGCRAAAGAPLRGSRIAAAFLGVVAFATVAYWISFFTQGDVQVRTDEVYLVFERAFPLADAWLASCALTGSLGLFAGRSWGFLFGLLASSSLVFLGCMDLLFNLNEGLYRLSGPAIAAEIAIEATCLISGPVLIVYLWRRRRDLLAGD